MADGYISQIKLPNEETYDFRDRNLKVYTGSCSTAAGTAIKDVTTDGEFTLAKGAVIFVNFSATNTAAVADLKLRVNSNAANDAKPIKHEYNASEANLPAAGYLRANQTYQFYYDGTNWVTDVGRDANSTYSYMRPYENTGKGSYNSQGENPAKTGSAGWRFQLSAGKYFMYSHYYDNTAKSALTLNIGSTGAKPIYINGQPSSSTNYTLPGGQYLVYYDGTNYYFRTDDKMTGNITGNAATATTATNLSAKPSLAASGKNITVTAGGKTSDAFTVPYATSAGSATNATYIKCTDTRNTTLNPTDLTAAQGVRFDFKAKDTIGLTASDYYAGVMSFRPYASNSDWSGGNAHQIAFNSEGLHWRNGSASWENWYQILDSNNTAAGTNNAATLAWSTTYTIAKINNVDIKFTTMAKPSYAFTDLTEHPTTLSGYGITDAASSNHSHTLKIGNKSLSVGASEQEWTVHDILYNSSHNIGTDTSWDIIEPGVYSVASSSAFTGEQNPSSNGDQSAPYTYGHAFTIRARGGGASQFYINHIASESKHSSHGIRYRSGWAVTDNSYAYRWCPWATILDDKNFNLYAPTLTGGGASGSWGISVTGTAANVTGTVAIAHGGTGATTASAAANALISELPVWTATPTADTYFIRRDTTGAAAFGQVKFSSIANITNNTLTLGPYSSTLVTSVNGNIGAVTITAADLGLSNALHFIGITSTTLADGSTTTTLTAKSTNSLSKTTGFVDGDVVMDGDQLREYVWSGDAWRLLGFTTSNIYNSDSIPASSSNEPTWISNIQQATDGKISVQRQTIGTLGIGHGGTGKSEWTQWGIVYASATNTLAQVTAGASTNINQPLISGGAAAPEWYAGLTLAGNGTQESPYDATFNNTVTITGATTLSSTLSVADNSTLTGKVGIGASPDNNYQLYVNGNSQFNGNLIPTITNNNADKTLGSSDARWAKLYIGNADNHGDAYTPIYWHEGVPTTVTLVQQCAFTINSGKSGVRLTHAAINAKSYVTQIVVSSGESNLNSAISWQSYNGANTGDPGYIELTCSAVSGQVDGYIMISRGDEITATATDITPE